MSGHHDDALVADLASVWVAETGQVGGIPVLDPVEERALRAMLDRLAELGWKPPSIVDRSGWWVSLDGYDDPCIWTVVPGAGPCPLLRSHRIAQPIWAYLVEGIPDRGACADCTAVACPEHAEVPT